MLLKKIHHLKTKIKSHISNMDLLEIVVEDNNAIRKEIDDLKSLLEEKDKEIDLLNKKVVILEKLNVSYSNDVLMLAQAVTEQYEILCSMINKEYLISPEDLFMSDLFKKHKKKKIVH